MKNVLLISLDTVRADVAYSGQFKAIEFLRKRGVTFLNAISSSPLTPISHATVFTGRQPYEHGIRHLFKEQIDRKVKTVTQLFKKEGYETGAIVSCPGMNKWYGHSRGFDHYDDEIPKLADGTDPLLTVDVKKRGTALKRAPLVTERAYKWLKDKKDKNYFLFIHFFDAHWPYEAPEKFGGNNIYEEEVAYTDHYLYEFLTKIDKEGYLKDTTIIMFSDHGEDLEGMYPNDKGGKKLGHPEEFGHGCLLYDQTQKVVLVVSDKNLPKGKDVEQQVRLLDIAPTLMELVGLKTDNRFTGVSLVPVVKRGLDLNLPAYSETYYPEEQYQSSGKYKSAKNKVSMRYANKSKVIANLNDTEVEMYDLENDKNELVNLLKKKPSIK
jgi:arylsulfatase A-like enzyme